MPVRVAVPLLASCLALAGCGQSAEDVSAPTPTPTATVTVAVPVPIPATGGVTASPAPRPPNSKGIASEPDPALCGADKLGPYLELLPTTTAKEEIAKTLGHNRIRYVSQAQAMTDGRPDRLTAVMGVDGRIKQFHCG